jgi:flagellar operon protein
MTDFRLEAIKPAEALKPGLKTDRKVAAGAFDTALAEAGLRLSQHAGQRLAARDIRLGQPEVTRLAEAVSRAEQKGSRDSLILMDDLAFIVDVERRTLVTAIDANNQKEGVFTNIDSVVLAK